MRRTSFIMLLSIASTIAACGGGDSGAEYDPDDPVLQIISEGGFIPVEISLNTGPRYTLLGDGRLIYQGVQTMEFPGRLVPPYWVARLNDNQLNAVLAMVSDIGLPEIDEELDNSALNFVADASTEVITYWDGNGKHRYGVYALGFEEEPSERNTAFQELITTLDRFTGSADAEPYQPDRVRVLAGQGVIDPEFEDVREWPLGDSNPTTWETLPVGWSCQMFGPEVLGVFDDATQVTTWEHPDGDSDPVQLLVRPLHPGESDCPETA